MVTMARADPGLAFSQVKFVLGCERKRVKGKTVVMKHGKYKGRKAEIGGVIVEESMKDGSFYFAYLCYVLRSDGSGPLNSDGSSRSYRPETDFEWSEE